MNVRLHKRRLQGHQAKDQTFTGLDLSDTAAFQSKWISCEFTNCDIQLSDFSGAYFENCQFNDCDLRLTSFRGAALRQTVFSRCNLRKSTFFGCAPLKDVEFNDCEMQHSFFNEASLFDTKFIRSNLHGADLRFVEAYGCEFSDSMLWGAAVTFGCQFFNSTFDERSVGMLVAFAARTHPVPETATLLREISGKNYEIAARLMNAPQDRVEEGEKDGLP